MWRNIGPLSFTTLFELIEDRGHLFMYLFWGGVKVNSPSQFIQQFNYDTNWLEKNATKNNIFITVSIPVQS